MSFSIRFLNKPIPEAWLLENEQGYLVRVTINDFNERDTVLTGFWTKDDYIKQWIQAASMLTQGDKHAKAAFATVVHNPKDPRHGYVIQWWTAYRSGEDVYIRSEAVQYHEHAEPIDLTRMYEYIPDRKVGESVSEWKVSVGDVVQFGKALDENRF